MPLIVRETGSAAGSSSAPETARFVAGAEHDGDSELAEFFAARRSSRKRVEKRNAILNAYVAQASVPGFASRRDGQVSSAGPPLTPVGAALWQRLLRLPH